MNILLLEDDLELSAVASEQIESRGHKVIPAVNIEQAKAIIADEAIDIDIMIADHLLPDGNGSKFALETKQKPDGIKVVVVSGQLNHSDIEELDAGGVGHYGKPSLYSQIVEDVVHKHF
jgi:DNA-binding response OmpR family regulator